MASVRLGRSLNGTGEIPEGLLPEALCVLDDYKELARQHGVDRIVTVGTHLFRKAVNASRVCNVIKEHTGLEVEILSRREEARWSYQGAVYRRSGGSECVVVDIGGGSTEIVRGLRENVLDAESFDIGAVTLTESFLLADPPGEEEISKMEVDILSRINASNILSTSGSLHLIGTGGTVTTLAALDLELNAYDAQRVDGHILSHSSINKTKHRLSRMNREEIKKWLAIAPDRADIILAGTCILDGIMTNGHFEKMLVSDRSLRFGIALREFRNEFDKRRT